MRTYKEQIPEILGPVITGQSIMFPGGADPQQLSGIKSELFFNDPDVNVEVSLLAAEYLGVIGAGSTFDVYNFEARALGQSVKFSEYGVPDVDYTDPLCKDADDLDKLRWPTENPLDAGRYPMALRANELVEQYTGMPVGRMMCIVSSFSLAVELFSFAGFIKIIKKQPDLAHEIMRRLTYDIHVPLVKALAEKYPGIHLQPANAWEVLPNISPSIQREYAWAYYDALIDAVRDVDAKVTFGNAWGESYVDNPIDFLIEKAKYGGAILFLDQEPNMQRETYVQAANQADLMLSLIITTHYHERTPAEIIEYFRGLAKDMRYPAKQFSWAGAAPFGTPLETIVAGIAAGKAFSVNPCPTPEELDKIVVEVPEITTSFGDFVRAKAAENPDGYTYKWLDQARFIGE